MSKLFFIHNFYNIISRNKSPLSTKESSRTGRLLFFLLEIIKNYYSKMLIAVKIYRYSPFIKANHKEFSMGWWVIRLSRYVSP